MSLFFNPELRADDPAFDDKFYNPGGNFWGGTGAKNTTSGVYVNEDTALTYMAVSACITLISGDIAKIPVNVYRKNPNGDKEIVLNHPLQDILKFKANRDTAAFNWKELAQSDVDLTGNHYSQIVRDSAGRILELVQILNPIGVRMNLRSSGFFYIWDSGNGEVTKPARDIFHLPGFSRNGIKGMSPIAQQMESIGLGMATDEFGSRFFGQGTNLAGYLETSKPLGENADDFIKSFREQFSSLGKSHSVMVLKPGQKYNRLTIPLNEAQFLETKKFQKQEICGFYHVPPHKLAIFDSNANRSNLEQENTSYVDSCLVTRLSRFENHISMQLLTQAERNAGLFVEFLVTGLLRGNAKERSEYYNRMFSIGAYSPNDIRRKENENSLGKEGDQYFVPLNFIPLGQAGERNEPFVPDDERSLEFRVSGIKLRDRIRNRFYPKIWDAAKKIVNREIKEISKRIEKRVDADKFDSWLAGFYGDFKIYIKNTMGPVMREYALASSRAIKDELGVDNSQDAEIETFVNEYIDGYANRYANSSSGQISSLDGDNEKITERLEEWDEKRPDKEAENESHREINALFSGIAFTFGMSITWTIRGKTCDYCKQLSGKTISRKQVFQKDGESIIAKNPETGKPVPMISNGIKRHPPLHQGCFPGNSDVSAFGITATSERWFDGNLIVINTATGNKVSCTPDHPILTCHGWMPAKEIEIGNHVRKATLPDRDSAIIRYNQNMQSTIENVAKTFLDHGKMIAIPVPASTEDFDSNIPDGKITIIRADGSLLLERDPSLFHKLREFNLSVRNADFEDFTSAGLLTEFFKTYFPPGAGNMSSRDLLLSLGAGHPSPINETGFTLPSMSNTVSKQVFINHGSGNSESIRNGINRFSIEILFDEVVNVENNVFHGLVYNLHTKDNLFYAENIVVHNCDCYLSI